MPASRIVICHRSLLLSECLAASLNVAGSVDCKIVMPRDVLANPPSSVSRVAIDLLLLEATMDEDLSIRIAERIKAAFPACKIVLLLAVYVMDKMFEFAQIGSDGHLFEGVGLSDARLAIQKVLGGEKYCSPQLVDALLSQVSHIDPGQEQSRQRSHASLTLREREILELVAYRQMGNKQIARQLKISLYTVKNHVHNIIGKLGVLNRHEAVQYARRRGLLVSESIHSGDSTRPGVRAEQS